MPTERFVKLRPLKKDAIRNAVVEELLRTSYGEMQISNIARKAQISRGSLYTYFHNREDLFLYALDQSWKGMLEYEQKKLLDCGGDYWEMNRRSLSHQLEVCRRIPIYRMLFVSFGSKILDFHLQEDQEKEEELGDYRKWIYQHADREILMCSEQKFAEISSRCRHLQQEFIQKHLVCGESADEIKKQFEASLNQIRMELGERRA